MLFDIITIVLLVVFTLVGAILHFNGTSRKIYSFISAMGLTTFLLLIAKKFVIEKDWYLNISNKLGGAIFNIIVYVILFFLGTVLLTFLFRLVYKLIDKVFGSICKVTSVGCGLVFGLANGALAIMTFLGFMAIFNIPIASNLFQPIVLTIASL